MNSREQYLARQGRAACNSKQRPAMVRRPKLASMPVELPKPDVGSSGGERHPLFAFLEQIFDAQPPPSLKQQGGDDQRLQANDRESRNDRASIFSPDRRLLEQDRSIGRKVAFVAASSGPSPCDRRDSSVRNWSGARPWPGQFRQGSEAPCLPHGCQPIQRSPRSRRQRRSRYRCRKARRRGAGERADRGPATWAGTKALPSLSANIVR